MKKKVAKKKKSVKRVAAKKRTVRKPRASKPVPCEPVTLGFEASASDPVEPEPFVNDEPVDAPEAA